MEERIHVSMVGVMQNDETGDLMRNLVGGDFLDFGPAALGTLAKELRLLSHYCATTDGDDAGALGMLEDVLLSMSERAEAAVSVAIAELQGARQSGAQ